MPERVLVVDDDEMSRELLAVLLEAEGYTVESADSGDAALAQIRSNESPPLVVLTDCQMPGTSGASLAGKLRRACGPATLLLAMSGSQPVETTISNFDGFLLKPFKIQDLAAALSSWTRPADTTATQAAKKRKPATASPALETGIPKVTSGNSSAPKLASNLDMNTQLHEAQAAESGFTQNNYDSPVLNEKIYGQLARAMPAQQLHEMYALCVNDARERIAEMRRLEQAHDHANFSRQAHAIKGSSGMLGATQLHGMAAELEKTGVEDPAANSAQDVNSLDELSAACDRLERMLGSRV